MTRPGISHNSTLSSGWRGQLFPVIAVALATAALLMLAAAGLGTRLGLWQFRTGFALLGYAAYCGCAALLAGAGAAIFSFRTRQTRGVVLALAALVAGAAITAVPVSWKLTARQLPRIHDITTDTATPPLFVALLPLRANVPNPAAYGGPGIAALQRTAYPDIRTVVLDLPQAGAFEAALRAANAMGWRIVAAVPGEGRIEATDTTFWFGFKDDIVIRVTPAGNRAHVDIRSVSRVGLSDVGTNARRIRAYVKKLVGS